MAWIEVHQGLRTHPKLSDLKEGMGWEQHDAIGRLVAFWLWCVDYCDDGDLRRHNDTRIGAAVGLNGEDAKRFVAAMVSAGWLERKPYFRVHDWWDYADHYLKTKYKDAPEKWQRIRVMYHPLRNTRSNTGGNSKNQPTFTNQPTNQPSKK